MRGNVHTGATPPWLRDDGSNDAGGSMPSLIGPSVDEFILHSKPVMYIEPSEKMWRCPFTPLFEGQIMRLVVVAVH